MSKSFSQAPKPLSAEVISAFERTGAGQDTLGRESPIVQNRESTNVGSSETAVSKHALNVESVSHPKVEMGEPTNTRLGVTTKPAKAEPSRLSIDLPESWHRRFKTACTRADKKMIDEVTEFIKRRTLELEQD
jgi:hypothetical protein